ncbi:hypothetical protein LNV47_18120 [Paucibacter sp. DJ4R-1]|nr:hypothetical protein [Paucibacter sp. DJ4R-1]
MLFCVVRLRQKGVLIPRHHIVRAEGAPGVFQLAEEWDSEVRRTLRIARLVTKSVQPEDVLPPLHDATVLHAQSNGWTVTGWERGEEATLYQPAYQQTWLMRELPKDALEMDYLGRSPSTGAQTA